MICGHVAQAFRFFPIRLRARSAAAVASALSWRKATESLLWQLDYQNGLVFLYDEGRDHDILGGLTTTEAFEMADIDPCQIEEGIYCLLQVGCGQSDFIRC